MTAPADGAQPHEHSREQPGALRRLLRHTSNYSIGTLLITAASMVSFPIFTRTFSVAEYGMLGLVNATLGFLVGVGKLGLQQSVVRFYAEIESGKRPGDRRSFFSTVLFGMLGVGAIASVLSAVTFVLLPSRWWGGNGIEYLIAAAAPLVLVRVLDSAMLNLLRAEQRSAFYSAYTVIRKYLGLALILAVLFVVSRSLWGFFIATMVSEALALAYAVLLYARKRVFQPSAFSPQLFVAMLGFGLPLLASELSSLLLSMGGRYIINFELGAHALGSYLAAYNFCDYLQSVLTGSFSQAVVPMYLRIWESQGREKTEKFLQQALRYYLMLALPVVAGMAAVAPALLRLLASDRYAVSTPLFVYIVSGMLLAGGSPIFSAGIYIRKMTRVVMYTVFVTTILNLSLTALLTRSMGIEGAALASLSGLCLYSLSTGFLGRGSVKLKMPWGELLHFGALSGLMYLAVREIQSPLLGVRVAEQIAGGVLIYGVMILATDRGVRSLAMRLLSQRFPRMH